MSYLPFGCATVSDVSELIFLLDEHIEYLDTDTYTGVWLILWLATRRLADSNMWLIDEVCQYLPFSGYNFSCELFGI